MDKTSITAWVSLMGAARLRKLLERGSESSSSWVRILALDGMTDAQLCYGRMLLEGHGVMKDQATALLWLKQAAAKGNLEAINLVGRCLESGWGTAVDPAAASECYQRAADGGDAWAQYNLGHCYLNGIGVFRDVSAAFYYYGRAAAQGHSRAMNLMGRCCEQGWGTPADPSAAARWYRRSAEGGYFRGQFNWATVLIHCDRDRDAAFWLERAAHGGTEAVRHAVLEIADRAQPSSAVAALSARLRADIQERRA